MDHVNIEISVEDRIGIIVISRPRVLNALDIPTLEQLEAALSELEGSGAVGLVIITGTGSKAFCAGADIKESRRLTEEELLERVKLGQRVFNKIENLQKPVIAAINGYALGGGCELAMACDLRIASKESKMGLPELKLGGIPGWGGTQRLARLVGKGRAMELILSGRMVEAQQAKEMGLISMVFPADELLEKTKKLASEIIIRAPQALKYAKWAVNKSVEVSLQVGLDYEVLYSSLLFATRDNKEGAEAFLEKRGANFKGE